MANLQSKVQGLSARFRQMMLRRSSSGFTLIELMVVVAILGILLAIAVPSYRQHVAKSKRADAKATLLDLAARQERFYSTNNSYTATAANLGYTSFPLKIPSTTSTNYNITVTATATTYTAQAAPTGAQASDSCGTFTINQLGVQGVTGPLPASQCW